MIRRRPAVMLVVVALVVIVGATAVGSAALVGAPFKTDADKWSAIGVAIGGGTFLLAAVAGLVAAVAYAQTSRRPKLEVKVELSFETAGVGGTPLPPMQRGPITLFGKQQPRHAPFWSDAYETPPGRLTVTLTNAGDAAARNVVVTIEIVGVQLERIPQDLAPGWTLDDLNLPLATTRFRWEGGVDLAVHQKPAPGRRLPLLTFGNTYAHGGSKVMASALAMADGAPLAAHAIELPVRASPLGG